MTMPVATGSRSVVSRRPATEPQAIDPSLFWRRGWLVAGCLVLLKIVGSIVIATRVGARISRGSVGPFPALKFEVSNDGFARIIAQSTLFTAFTVGIALLVSILMGWPAHWIAAFGVGVAAATNMAIMDQVLTSYLRGVTDASTVRWTFGVLLPSWLLGLAWLAVLNLRLADMPPPRRS